jgi:hypothetical protein
MSSSEVEVHLTCYDEASDVIEEAGSTISTTFTDIEGNTQELASTTSDATGQMAGNYQQLSDSAEEASSSIDDANMSCTQSAMSMSTTAMSGAALYMSFNNIENAEISLNKAHLAVEKATNAVTLAQQAYTAAVAKYGPDSQQATDALNKLNLAQQTLTVDQERAGEAQRNLTNSYIMVALTVIPSLVSVVNLVSNATQIWTGIQAGLNAVMDANPLILVALAIAGLVAAIIYAYNACPPFRDVIKELAAIIGTSLAVAVEGITAAVTWLWKSVFEPFGNFLETYIMTEVKAIMDVALALWGVLRPFGEFLGGVFTDAWKAVADVINWFYNLLKPIFDAIDTAAKALGGFVNDVSGAMKEAGKAITGFIGSICFAHALQGAADSSQKTMKDWNSMIQESMDKGLASIKDFNAQAQISSGATAGAIGGGAPLPSGPSKPTVVNIDVKAPLVNVEGSADKATADLASKQVLQALQTIIVAPTSPGAAATQKRISSGSVFT